MMITRDNYEIWFLDYMEGKLSKEDMEMVRIFLRENPEIKDRPEGYMPALDAGRHLVYPRKERLKRAWHDDPALLETTAIAAMEGDLSAEERKQFDHWFENNPDARKLVNDLVHTKLQSDLQISFPGKGRLKKTTILATSRTRVAAVAAIAAMLMLVFLVFPPSKKQAGTSSLKTAETEVPLKKSAPGNSPVAAVQSPLPSKEETASDKTTANSPSPEKTSKSQAIEPLFTETRSFVPIEKLEPKPVYFTSNTPVMADLVLIKRSAPVYYASGEMPLSEFFNHRLQTLKASQTEDSFTREEFKVAGLRLFSRIPGSHLTGKKGRDGRLKSISFNTQMLAFSIPVNQ